jgi:hypothetical protein
LNKKMRTETEDDEEKRVTKYFHDKIRRLRYKRGGKWHYSPSRPPTRVLAKKSLLRSARRLLREIRERTN